MSIFGKIVEAIRSLVGDEFGPTELSAALDKREKEGKERLDWRNSIVDLMKLVGMDSSYTYRKELAKELGYTGHFGDPAMNIWLHEQVMAKLAKNRGVMP